MPITVANLECDQGAIVMARRSLLKQTTYYLGQVEQIAHRHVSPPDSRSQAREQVRLPLPTFFTEVTERVWRVSHEG